MQGEREVNLTKMTNFWTFAPIYTRYLSVYKKSPKVQKSFSIFATATFAFPYLAKSSTKPLLLKKRKRKKYIKKEKETNPLPPCTSQF